MSMRRCSKEKLSRQSLMMVAAVLSTVEAKEVVLRKGKKGEGDALMKRCVMLLF